MATLVPTITTALVSSGVGLVTNEISRQTRRVQNDQSLEQLKARQDLQAQQSAQDAALERQRIDLDARTAEEERKNALRRAVSRQRANFGAQGIGSGTGSSQAVLLGLFDESDEERARREELDNIRLNSIDQDLGQRNSLSVLQRTQLEERNKVQAISGGFQTLGDVLKTF